MVAGNSLLWLVADDFNVDGKADVVGSTVNQLLMFVGNGDGTFQSPISVSPIGDVRFLESADLNGDGKPDLTATNFNGGSVSIILENGDGPFHSPISYAVPPSQKAVLMVPRFFLLLPLLQEELVFC